MFRKLVHREALVDAVGRVFPVYFGVVECDAPQGSVVGDVLFAVKIELLTSSAIEVAYLCCGLAIDNTSVVSEASLHLLLQQ